MFENKDEIWIVRLWDKDIEEIEQKYGIDVTDYTFFAMHYTRLNMV